MIEIVYPHKISLFQVFMTNVLPVSQCVKVGIFFDPKEQGLPLLEDGKSTTLAVIISSIKTVVYSKEITLLLFFLQQLCVFNINSLNLLVLSIY